MGEVVSRELGTRRGRGAVGLDVGEPLGWRVWARDVALLCGRLGRLSRRARRSSVVLRLLYRLVRELLLLQGVVDSRSSLEVLGLLRLPSEV